MRNFNIGLLSTLLSLTVSCCFGQVSGSRFEENVIKVERSEYGLIFTDIRVNGQSVKAMIDFGDPHILSISSSLVDTLNIETEEAGYKISDVYGNTWEVYQGNADSVNIGSKSVQDIGFTTQEGEMESVSEQIGTEFHAVLGWGFFKNYFTEIDYKNSEFRLYENAESTEGDVFEIPFSAESGQIIVDAELKGKEVKFMIDTGSPVSVFDTFVVSDEESDNITFMLSDQKMKLTMYSQDLSVLSDLGVVGILGGDFLEKWKIVINPNDQTLHFKLTALQFNVKTD